MRVQFGDGSGNEEYRTCAVVVDELRSLGRKIDHVTGEIHDRLQAEGEERRADEKQHSLEHQRIWNAIQPRDQ